MKTFSLLIFSIFAFSNWEIPKKELILLNYQWLRTTDRAHHVGGDTELKQPQRVRLTGNFTLKIEGGNLVGELFANFKEMDIGHGGGTDNTEFVSRTNYLVYQPKSGYKVVDFRILYDVHPTSSFNFMGRGYQQDDVPNSGPVLSINWKGDTGKKGGNDNELGCIVTPRLKRINVIIEEIK